MTTSWKLALATVLMTLTGCSNRPEALSAPKLNADKVGQLAIEQYDADGDGALSEVELQSCPGLGSSVAKFDADGDGNLSAEEIASRYQTFVDADRGFVSFICKVTLDGKPLVGATVALTPEEFMGKSIQSATGVTAVGGGVRPSMERSALPSSIKFGMYFGVYQVRITHPEKDIPARYNSATELGVEVGPDYDFYNPMTFSLES